MNYEIVKYMQGVDGAISIHSVGNYNLHYHKELELLFVLSGEIKVVCEGKKYQMREEDICLINSGDMHATIGGQDNIVIAIQIAPEFYSKHYPQLQETRFIWPEQEALVEQGNFLLQLKTGIATIVDEYRRGMPGYKLMIEGLLNMLLSMIMRNVPHSEKGYDTATEKNNKPVKERIIRVTEFIKDNYKREILLGDIAKTEFVNTSYLSRIFKEHMGISFQEYINSIRLQKAVEKLINTDSLINDIAFECGFANIKAFHNSFRKKYHQTPGEYRKLHKINDSGYGGSGYLEFSDVKAFSKLQKYLKVPILDNPLQISPDKLLEEVNIKVSIGSLFKDWKKIGAVGRAYDILRADLQEQIGEFQAKIGITHLRFHGIFSDEMRVVTRNQDGSLNIFFDIIDKVLDYLIDVGIAPFIDLTFMPDALKSNNKTVLRYAGNISQPAVLGEWCLLIHEFMLHIKFRYGAEEVRRWYFEIWNEPDYIWDGTWQEYLEFYRETVQTIKTVDQEFKIAGPCLMPPNKMNKKSEQLKAFVEYIRQHNLPLDCFTFHLYGEDDISYWPNEKAIAVLGNNSDYKKGVAFYQNQLKPLGKRKPETIITEYGIAARHGNYLLDTMYPACRYIQDMLELQGDINGLAYWVLSDIFEENYIQPLTFHGGFGMVTKEGIKKPVWYAAWFLSKLGTEILMQTDSIIVTRKGDEVQVLAFCIPQYDQLFKNGDCSGLDYERRYEVFAHKNPLEIKLTLTGVEGKYQIDEYRLDREHGSAYDVYLKMGMPAELLVEQVEYLKAHSGPEMVSGRMDIQGAFDIHIYVPVHGIYMAKLKKYE